MTHTAKPVRIADWNRMGTRMLLRKFSWSPVRLLFEQRLVQAAAGAHLSLATHFRRAVTSISTDFPSGSVPTTRILRLLSRPIALFVRMCRQCCLEQSNNCGMRLRWESVWSFGRGFPPQSRMADFVWC